MSNVAEQSTLPEVGEIVVCKIAKILDYGAFVELQEYEGVQGFVHVSQVASSWVKNIRNFVKENQIRAAKVIHTDSSKNQVDLSFTKVSQNAQREKIEQFRQNKRMQKLIEMLAKEKNASFDTVWKEVAEPLLKNYDSLYDAFQAIALEGMEAAPNVPKEWHKKLVELVKKNIEVAERTVKGVLTLTSTAQDGVVIIKNILITARDSANGANVDISYLGSGRYFIKATSHDYKAAERILRTAADYAISAIKSKSGYGKFEIMEK